MYTPLDRCLVAQACALMFHSLSGRYLKVYYLRILVVDPLVNFSRNGETTAGSLNKSTAFLLGPLPLIDINKNRK